MSASRNQKPLLAAASRGFLVGRPGSGPGRLRQRTTRQAARSVIHVVVVRVVSVVVVVVVKMSVFTRGS
jgi:hypothetical protein